MSCEQCPDARAAGAVVCDNCGELLAPADVTARPYLAGFLLSLMLAAVGFVMTLGSNRITTMLFGIVAGPGALMIVGLVPRLRPLAVSGALALAVVVIVFGGCMIMFASTLGFH